MPFQPLQIKDIDARTVLLGEAVELLRGELSILSNATWEDLPELKKKKTVLAARLREVNWAYSPRPVDWLLLKTQIADLEDQLRQKIEARLKLIGNQILALQEQNLYWRECLSISFRKI